jgi:hypothetical protein
MPARPNTRAALGIDMTLEELKQIEDRANAATPGPWVHDTAQSESAVICGHTPGVVCDWRKDAAAFDDCVFIAHTRADVPNLIAEVKRLREVITQGVYPHEDFLVNVCPWCEGYSKNNSKDPNAIPDHEADCPAFNPDGSMK